MKLLNISNDILEIVKEPSKAELIAYYFIASALIVGSIWIFSKVVKFLVKIFKRK